MVKKDRTAQVLLAVLLIITCVLSVIMAFHSWGT
jgi:hypothetical protein